jgi:hypothetical protein
VPIRNRFANPGVKTLEALKERLEQQSFRLFEQMQAVNNKIAGIELSIAALEKGTQAPVQDEPESATNLKVLLLDLAREAGATGINSNTAVELASKRGIKLLRGSAASNLSRLKADNALVHDGKVYRLPEFTRPQLQLAVGGKGS